MASMSSPPPSLPPYKDPWQPVEARVKDLLSRMTLEEKVAQMAQIDISVSSPHTLTRLAVGSVLNGGGSAPKERASAEEWADMVDKFQSWALDSRLAVPIIYATDAVHGNSNIYGATIFPHNVGLGAARDGDLVRRIGAATALEVRATGIHCSFAPCVAVCKDPRWGRCYESYSEDTAVVCEMAALVSGLQGLPPKDHPNGYPYLAGRENVIACAKHFVGDGGTKNGVNEGDTICSMEDLERMHLKPYLGCLAMGISTVMASYSSWNGGKMHSHRFLLTDVLKEKLGFKGFVISDWEGVDRLHEPRGSNYRSSILASINAGVDMVMIPFRYEQFLEDLLHLAESGEIPMTRIDDAVERILRVKFVSGLFEHPFSDRSLVKFLGCEEHHALAREAVRKSLVLLKNGKDARRPFLPLDRNERRILVAGTHADDIGYQCGGWTIAWGGGKGRITTGTTILEGIREAMGNASQVIHEEVPSPATLQDQDISMAIAVVGEPPYSETDGDRTELSIPLDGAEIIRAVASKFPTLVVIIAGRPLVLDSDLLEKVEAVVVAWLPGSEGGGVADVLFGDYDFHGVLPVSWMRSVQQLAMDKEHPSYDPLFPLEFGLKMFGDN